MVRMELAQKALYPLILMVAARALPEVSVEVVVKSGLESKLQRAITCG